MRLIAHVLCALIALPAAAQSTMGAAEFDAYTQGKTLLYGNAGAPYGAEEYLPDRRVRWSFLDGECREGEWYEDEDGLICFVYEDDPEPHCWSFIRGPGGLIAQLENDPIQTELYEASETGQEMLCLGPEVGV